MAYKRKPSTKHWKPTRNYSQHHEKSNQHNRQNDEEKNSTTAIQADSGHTVLDDKTLHHGAKAIDKTMKKTRQNSEN